MSLHVRGQVGFYFSGYSNSTFKGYALVNFIFGSATSIAEWKADAQKDGYDLAAVFITTLIKTIVVAALTTAIIAAIVFAIMILFGFGISVVVVGLLSLFIGGGVGYYIESAEKSAGRALTNTHQITMGWRRLLRRHSEKQIR